MKGPCENVVETAASAVAGSQTENDAAGRIQERRCPMPGPLPAPTVVADGPGGRENDGISDIS